MDDSSLFEALRITARVTAVAALAGCGGATVPTEPMSAQPPSAPPPGALPPTTQPSADPSAPLADPPLAARDPVAACEQELAKSGPSDPCCVTILDAIRADWSTLGKVDNKIYSACCAEHGSHPACTPWGPPMPVEMV